MFRLLESIKAFDKVWRVQTQSPTQQHIQKCDPQILKPTLTFPSALASTSKVSLYVILYFCANKSDTILQKRYNNFFLLAFIQHYQITSLNKFSYVITEVISALNSAYIKKLTWKYGF